MAEQKKYTNRKNGNRGWKVGEVYPAFMVRKGTTENTGLEWTMLKTSKTDKDGNEVINMEKVFWCNHHVDIEEGQSFKVIELTDAYDAIKKLDNGQWTHTLTANGDVQPVGGVPGLAFRKVPKEDDDLSGDLPF